MMETLLDIAAAALSLAGCVAVPVYSEPVPAYDYYYAPPVATFSFGFHSSQRLGHGHRHGYRR